MKERVCIYGAGAIGGFLAARLAHAGLDVGCVARGAQLEAIRSHGLRLIEADRELHVDIPCTDKPRELGVQDIVVVTLKAHALTDNIDGIRALASAKTPIVTIQNGLPWWYFFSDRSPLAGQTLESVDPGRRIWRTLGPERAIGAVVYPAAEIVEPGKIRHLGGDRITVGEPDGMTTARISAIREILDLAGLTGSVGDSIRAEIWLKLAVNAAINPLSVIKHATISEILEDDGERHRLTDLIGESRTVANALGVELPMSPENLVAALRDFGAHKTSMLVDYELGRPLEIEPMTGAVLDIASRMQIRVPTLKALYEEVKNLT
jgi:2-dehydropantoate 2-reductase